MKITTLLTTVTLTLLGTMLAAQEVTYDFNPRTDFTKFQTYAWVRGTVVNDPLIHDRIVNALDAQFAAKGLRLVSAGGPADVLVAYHASVDRDLEITGFSSGWGGYRFPGSRTGVARTEEILSGTLIVDIVNAQTRTIVWRGIATREIDMRASPAKRDKIIHRVAEKLLKQYPPSKSGAR